MGYLNHVDLLMPHVHVLKKLPYCFVHLGCFVNFILCPTDKYMFNVNNQKIRLICWMCSKLKPNTTWHRSNVFVADFEQSQYINAVSLDLTANKYLSLGCERQVVMFWKYKKRHISLVAKAYISFSDLSLHRIEINYEQMTIMNILHYQKWFYCFVTG